MLNICSFICVAQLVIIDDSARPLVHAGLRPSQSWPLGNGGPSGDRALALWQAPAGGRQVAGQGDRGVQARHQGHRGRDRHRVQQAYAEGGRAGAAAEPGG
eukprot:TRINITY_DN101409_c0_g1_i2.p3 TRINITY_DN101409_c0_g1~~TRINITY_DN101409_c0_g1_i2.p3  ORF type:complete len:118 (-),score=11.97 TRINITY_DN101409_c0_g1_i2:123-425(-)